MYFSIVLFILSCSYCKMEMYEIDSLQSLCLKHYLTDGNLFYSLSLLIFFSFLKTAILDKINYLQNHKTIKSSRTTI